MPSGSSRHRRPASRCPQFTPLADCLGSLLSAHAGSPRSPQAITATAHKLARLVYGLLKHGRADVQQGIDAYETHYRERTVKVMVRQAKPRGYALVPLAKQG